MPCPDGSRLGNGDRDDSCRDLQRNGRHHAFNVSSGLTGGQVCGVSRRWFHEVLERLPMQVVGQRLGGGGGHEERKGDEEAACLGAAALFGEPLVSLVTADGAAGADRLGEPREQRQH